LFQIIAYNEEISRKIIGSYAYVVTPNTPYYSPGDAEQEKVDRTIVHAEG
jgi:hypothetical protein